MSNKKLFGLGKGLNSLIPKNPNDVPNAKKESVFYVEVGKIQPNPDQPRKDFDKDALADLSRSIRKYGVLQPLLVSKVEDESSRGMNVYYELIAGERRLRAAQLAGLPHVPVIIRDDIVQPNKKSERLEVALIENIQRENLSPLEEAEAYVRLANEFGMVQREIAEKVGKSREVVANTIRLLKLPDYIKAALSSNKISMAHARALVSFEDPIQQKRTFDSIMAGGFTSKDIEDVAADAKGGKTIRKDARYIELEKNLCERLNVPVLIKSSPKGGQIVIRFTSIDQLSTIAKNIIDSTDR
jgi:ParB family transcriptional regulator, chromosome partitioning protein